MKRDSERGDVELLSAYVDGVGELPLDERKRVDDLLARDPALRAMESQTRALLGELRELPPSGNEPDWSALERGIGDAVATLEPRTWWQRWRWRVVVPAVALAMTAALLALVLRPDEPSPPATAPVVEVPAAPAERDVDELSASTPLWLDGTDLDVALEAAELFDLEWDLDSEAVPETAELLLPTDLEWVDELDGDALDRAEQYLEHPRNHRRGPS
jgi:anti-sigma factor RsiW